MTGRFAMLMVWAALCLGFIRPTTAVAAEDIAGPVAGTTTGVVKVRSADFLLIQSPTEAVRRYSLWDNPTTTRPATTRPDGLVAEFNAVSVGDEVETRWTGEPRRRIESIKVTRRAAMIAALTAATQPAIARPTTVESPTAASTTQSISETPSGQPATGSPGSGVTTAPAASTGSTLGERVNATVDDLLALGMRLIELPMWMLLTAVIVIGGGLFTLARRLDRWNRPVASRRLRTTLRVGGVLFVALLIDRKIAGLQTQVDALRTRISSDALALIDKKSDSAGRSGRPLMFDPAAAQKSLATHFKDVGLQPSIYDAATDVVQVRLGDPLVKAYVAIVDLTNPFVTIKLGTDLTQKTLTSAFAKENGCGLAINGEAGQSPAMNSGLGVWRGNMVYDGKVILREDPKILRPFIGFDKTNRAVFVSAVQEDRTLPTDRPTVIWGRLDSIVNGVVQTADARLRQPRTAMGIGQNGTRLYLLVVDGRQQRRSVGVTRAEVGYLLQAFGCDNAMLCDEGGSSCMYLKQFGGIANVPSDNNGEERPTYTHFGVTLRETP